MHDVESSLVADRWGGGRGKGREEEWRGRLDGWGMVREQRRRWKVVYVSVWSQCCILFLCMMQDVERNLVADEWFGKGMIRVLDPFVCGAAGLSSCRL